MNFKHWETWIVGIIICAAVFFRTHHLEGKLTFEWDQSRDFAAVETMLRTSQLPLLGPVVRGDVGGFYLGPLYYYLITPLYYFSGGNPLSLAAIGIAMDICVVGLLYVFLRTKVSIPAAMIATIIWAGSPLIIHDAFTPWNVSLISLWTLSFLIGISEMRATNKFRYKLAVVFLASLTSNIHLSLVPVAAVLMIVNVKSFCKLTLKQYLCLALAAFVPVATLLIHDLTHNLENVRLFKQFLFGVKNKSGGFASVTLLVAEKYGYTIGRLVSGEPRTYLGWIVTATVMLYALIKKRALPITSSALLAILAVIGALIYYRDFDFAEYYFMPTYVALILLLSLCLKDLFVQLPKRVTYLLVIVVAILYGYLGYQVRQEPISPYSLTVKKMVITAIANLGYPVEVRTRLPRERNTAFPYLLQSRGISSDPSAPRKAYIYESKNTEVISPPEARSIILDAPIQGFKLIVFSN